MRKFSLLEKKDNDLSYTNFFGKYINHNEAFLKLLSSCLVDIICEEKEISEKSYKLYDEVIKEVSDKLPAYEKQANVLYKENKRIRYIAEILYHLYFK